MKVRTPTDYALRTLMYLGYRGEKARAEEIANSYAISKDHLVKVIQQLARFGYVTTTPGRNGGTVLAREPHEIAVAEVIRRFEGDQGIIDCVHQPNFCPLEPGCRLRKALMLAEEAFYESFDGLTIADLSNRRQRGGLSNLPSP